ncbi:MAG: hypothetical protein M3530_04635, partial [Thermoproteota archaeon]|nr:hypothetical protein [Thermoproteota archaeon]
VLSLFALTLIYSQNSFADTPYQRPLTRTDSLGLRDCGVFDSCIDPIIRFFPFMQFKWSSDQLGNGIQTSQSPQKDIFSRSIPFELPFP